MILPLNLGKDSYDIIIERGSLSRAGALLNLDRKVLIVTDEGVPAKYVQAIAPQCRESVIFRFPAGEQQKTLETWKEILCCMLRHDFSRKDCVAAVGGGICGDMGGFAAAAYMRGIPFYNIPTTMLAQVDSSIGGKTAVNLEGIKNIAGAFYQPAKVLIDPEVLGTLPGRQLSAGLAEALKMAVTFDEKLFRLFEEGSPAERTDAILEGALRIKKRVVEEDEKEHGLRKVLNFGHTIGHGIESLCLDGSLLHGECVAIGMLPMCGPEARARLLPVLEKLGLPTSCGCDPELVFRAMTHDKKAEDGTFTIIECDRIGTFQMRRARADELRARAAMVCGGDGSRRQKNSFLTSEHGGTRRRVPDVPGNSRMWKASAWLQKKGGFQR